MLRRVVSLFLVPALFLQGIGFGLSQGGACWHATAGHEQRLHFHLCMLGLYHHAHPDHHAGGDGKPDSRNDQALRQQAPTADHEEDAIYVSGSVMLRDRSSHSPAASAGYSALLLMDALVGRPVTTVRAAWRVSLPASSPAHYCSLYLRTRVLLL
jgi:hypothetical protein